MNKPDWDYWLHRRKIKLWEACALSINVDPDDLQPEPQAWMNGPAGGPLFQSSSFPSESAHSTFRKRLRRLSSYVRDRGAPLRFRPSEWGARAQENDEVVLRDFADWAVNVVRWKELPYELAALVHAPKARDSDTAQQVGPPPARQAIGIREDGEPPLRAGKNSRSAIQEWVTWQAYDQVKDGDTTGTLAERIRLIAERWRYESERVPLTDSTIVRMLPAGITGGRRGSHKKK